MLMPSMPFSMVGVSTRNCLMRHSMLGLTPLRNSMLLTSEGRMQFSLKMRKVRAKLESKKRVKKIKLKTVKAA